MLLQYVEDYSIPRDSTSVCSFHTEATTTGKPGFAQHATGLLLAVQAGAGKL
jgi:hypothetical protein